MALTAFTRDVAITQGRIRPALWTPQDSGQWVFCLGFDAIDQFDVIAAGDSVTVSQSADWAANGYTMRIPARLRLPRTVPLGVWWRASVLLNGVEVWGRDFPPSNPAKPVDYDLGDLGWVVAHLVGAHTIGFRLQLLGATGQYEVEIPAFYVDAITIDDIPARPALLNRDPSPGAVQIFADASIGLDLVDVGADGIDLTHTTISVNGVAAYVNGVFQTGFTGPFSAVTTPQSDTKRFVIDPLATFSSGQVVHVRVQTQTLTSALTLDQTYTFTAEVLDGPRILNGIARDQFTIRVTWDHAPLVGDGSGATLGDVLDPAHYEFLPVPGDAAVTPTIAAVAVVDAQTVDLTTDIEMTPAEAYTLVAMGVRDAYDNELRTTATVIGWQPPIPAGRSFNLYEMLPQKNRDEDTSQDLFKFCSILQEVLDLQLYDIDRFTDIVNIDTAPPAAVDAMLADLGNPFAFDLALVDKRRLVTLLIAIYRQKGVDIGMINAARFFLGLTISILYVAEDGWTLDVSLLGVDTILGTSDAVLRNSFDVSVTTTLTATQLDQLVAIVQYMKPAYTHLRYVIEPAGPPPPYDPVVLGVSRLGFDWLLH